MFAFLLRQYTREHDGPEQIRKKDIVIKACVIAGTILLVSFAGSTMFKSLTGENSQPYGNVTTVTYLFALFLCAWVLLHMYLFDLTSVVKVGFVTGFSVWVLGLCVADDTTPWHFLLVLILDLSLLLKSEKEEALMTKVSFIISLVMVVYLALRALAKVGIIPSFHLVRSECEHYGFRLEEVFVFYDFALNVTVISLNFVFVSAYALSARNEVLKTNESVDMATSIAEKLVNFDLSAAQDKLSHFDNSHSPIREPLHGLLRNLSSYRSFLPYSLFSQESHVDPPNEQLADAMEDEVTSWQHVGSAVAKLREPTYTLGDFHRDVAAAFPELKLYDFAKETCTSGHSGFEEYQRTMGAMYAVYCFARLDIDGRELLTFGVDEQWKPVGKSSGDTAEKMENFYKSMDWEGLARLMLRANLITVNGQSPTILPKSSWHETQSGSDTSNPSKTGRGPADSRPECSIKLNVERMTAMLVLTAIHDIMKNSNLLPTVQERHAQFYNIPAGGQIVDHDMALAYVLEQFPSLLPSYRGLEPGQRAPILFTQGKMGFNNGWMVQGEAPPAALFSSFKKVIVQGGASESDINFYFVHWLTDLAGAEPFGSRPWPGTEKFVSKFPLRVLNAFLESFSFIDHLASKSEVEVMEDYLESRWAAFGPPEQELEDGQAPAAMRLALMAQGFEAEIVDAFLALNPIDRETLALEMSRTGHMQQFRSAPASLRQQPDGPALLVYYAPALVQKASVQQAEMSLHILASVCRAARKLFPVEGHSAQKTAVVRIDALKVLCPEEIFAAGRWHLKKTSDSDACVVQRARLEGGSECDESTEAFAEVYLGVGSDEL